MSHTTHEPEDTPLEEVLRSLPEEDPPEDLRARIVDALAEQRKVLRPKPAKGQAWLPSLLAAAAVLVLVVSTQGPRMFGGGGTSRLAMPGPREVAMAKATQAAPAAKAPGVDAARSAAAPMTGARPAPPPAAEGQAVRGRDLRGTQPREEDSVVLYRRPAQGTDHAKVQDLVTSDIDSRRLEHLTESGPSAGDLPTGFDAPAEPWRDQTGERQSVTASVLDVEVKDVEAAYDRTRDVLAGAHGIVLSQELDLHRKAVPVARITTRVPLDQIDGVVAQVRALGEVVKLTMESKDRTREYYGRGTRIRTDEQTESDLQARIDGERDPRRKQQLQAQLESLRAANAGRKAELDLLSEQTHSVLLEITLTGRRGPGEFLARVVPGIGQAALWVLATAVLWGPLALAAWLLHRRARSAG
jgi:hypothetical protein